MAGSLLSLTKNRQRSYNDRMALIREYKKSGLSQQRFCESVGIKFSTFRNWLTRLRVAELGSPPAQQDKFESLVVLPAESASILGMPSQKRDFATSPAASCLEVRLGSSLSIVVPTGFHEGTLRRLIQIVGDLNV